MECQRNMLIALSDTDDMSSTVVNVKLMSKAVQFDLTWLTIRGLELAGLAKQIVRPSHRLVDIKP